MVESEGKDAIVNNPFAVAATLNASQEGGQEANEEEGKCALVRAAEAAQAAEEAVADPVWLGDLIRDGFYDKLVLIGFPYDEGARRAGNRRGSDFGPDSFRRFVKDIGSVRNPEYGVNIATGIPKIADYGNIQIESRLDLQYNAEGQVTAHNMVKPTI